MSDEQDRMRRGAPPTSLPAGEAPIPWICTKCKEVRGGWANPCPNCGGWNTVVRQRQSVLPFPAPKPGGLGPFEVEQALIATGIKPVPIQETEGAKIELIKSWEPFDVVMAGGFPRGTTCLLDGRKGLGKSTLATHVALAWPGKSCYVTAEAGQGPAFVSARAFRLAPGTKAELHVMKVDRIDLDRWDAVDTVLSRYSLVVVDSIQGFSPNYREQLELARLVGKSVEKTGGCGLLLSRVNAKGDAAGWEELPHQVDACLSLVEHSEAHAVLVATKNRNGALGRVLLTMGPKGMTAAMCPPAKAEG